MNRKLRAYSLIFQGRAKMALGRALMRSGESLRRTAEDGAVHPRPRRLGFTTRFALNAIYWVVMFFVMGLVLRLTGSTPTHRDLVVRAIIVFLFCLGNTSYQAWQAARRRRSVSVRTDSTS